MKKDNSTVDFTQIQTPNFDQLNDIFQNNLKIYNNFVNNISAPKETNSQSESSNGKTNGQNFTPVDLLNLINPTTSKITNSLFDISSKMTNSPDIYYQHINKWIQEITSLNFYFISRLSNKPADPVAVPDKTDKRFATPEWSENLFFDFIKQFYLLTSRMMDNIVDSLEHIDPKQKKIN
jgi:polyhydroxyalkanoate synthase